MDANTIQELLDQALPDYRIISTSVPEPPIQPFNVLGMFSDAGVARNAVLALASIEPDDAAIGLTVLEPRQPPAVERSDPDAALVNDIVPRAIKGAIVGFIVGAVVIGLAVALISRDNLIAGVLGGALMGATFGAVWGAFLKMGGGSAYRETFAAASDDAVTIVSLHTSDADKADEARGRLALQSIGAPLVLRVPA